MTTAMQPATRTIPKAPPMQNVAAVAAAGLTRRYPNSARPAVQARGESAVRVTLDAGAPPALGERLRRVLEPLPIQVHIGAGPPPAA